MAVTNDEPGGISITTAVLLIGAALLGWYVYKTLRQDR